jgi:hypothetical protein
VSKQAYVSGVQPDPPDGPLFGRNMDPSDFAKAQAYAHSHIERLSKDLLIAGSPGPTVSGFNLTLTGGLGLTIVAGAALDLLGYLYELDSASGVNLEAADGSNPRLDLIYASLQRDVPAAFDDRNFAQLRTDAELTAVPPAPPYAPTIFNQATELHTRAVIAVHKGTPAGSPTAPAAGAGEVALFQVHVGAGATTLSGGDVTDVRRTMRSLAQALVLIDAISGITGDINEVIDDRVAALLQEGAGVDLTYSDLANTLTIAMNLTGGAILAALGYVPVNKVGDTMTGPLNVPADGFLVGSGQLRAVAGNIRMSAESQSHRARLMGGVPPGGDAGDVYQLLFTDANEMYGHRIITKHANSVGSNVMDLYIWKFGTDSAPYPSTNVVFSWLDYLTICRTPLQVLQTFSCTSANIGGDCHVGGTLTKTAGTFLIDHPLDPQNKNLVHSFIEGPRPDLIYRGSVKLVKGQAIVSIDAESRMTPGTFDELTKNAQGTAWNESDDTDNFDLVRVVRIDRDRVLIKSNNPEASFEVGWMVIAERNDLYMRYCDSTDAAGRFITEIDKPEATAEDLASLDDRVEHKQSTDPKARRERVSNSTEPVLDLNGKRGYPMHPEAIGLASPTRSVITKTAPYKPPSPAPKAAAPAPTAAPLRDATPASVGIRPKRHIEVRSHATKGTTQRPSKASRTRRK